MIMYTVRDHLKGDAALVAKVPRTRIFTGSVAKGAQPPYIQLSLISNPGSTMGTEMSRIQISVFGKTYDDVASVAELVKGSIKSLDGIDGIFASYKEDTRDLYNDETEMHHIPVDGLFYYLVDNEFS